MGTVTKLRAKTRPGELLDRVSKGEDVVITRRQKPVARLIPEGRSSLETTRDVVSGLKALRKKIGKRKGFRPITDAEIRRSIEKGRR
jgi:prevent-host-death family protein